MSRTSPTWAGTSSAGTLWSGRTGSQKPADLHHFSTSRRAKTRSPSRMVHEPATPMFHGTDITLQPDCHCAGGSGCRGVHGRPGDVRLHGTSVPAWTGAARGPVGMGGPLGSAQCRRNHGDHAGTAAGRHGSWPLRTNPEGKALDFGFAVTNGAFRVQKVATGLTVTHSEQPGLRSHTAPFCSGLSWDAGQGSPGCGCRRASRGPLQPAGRRWVWNATVALRLRSPCSRLPRVNCKSSCNEGSTAEGAAPFGW